MKIVVGKELEEKERRVALVPSVVAILVKKGAEVVVEAGCGAGALVSDPAFEAAGARVVSCLEPELSTCDLFFSVRRPRASLASSLKKGGCVIGMLDPYDNLSELSPFAEAGLTLFSLELVPRITRAQGMDVLSSQANLAGYKAVVDAAALLGRAFPMMMTAAGTIPAARVFVMGAGVAGLQAIATARRLGAIVSATDVRAAAGEQIKSLGAKFIFVDGLEDAGTASGYAKALSPEDQKRQQELIAHHIKTQDVVITTALIPGKPAPLLITREMVESMQPGSVIIDLAVERGGNCALSKAGEHIEHQGVTVVGASHLPSCLYQNASALYAKNIANFADLLFAEGGDVHMNWEDEILQKAALIKEGVWVSR